MESGLIRSVADAASAAGASKGDPKAPDGEARLRAVGERFEAAFLAEMLRHSGFGEMRGGPNGGAGEAAVAPFMLEAVATEIARSKSLGIAEMVFARLTSAGEQK
ncbi:MAG: chemotaxis protein chel [Pseudomonadota bacterium]